MSLDVSIEWMQSDFTLKALVIITMPIYNHRLICSQLLLGFYIRFIGVFWNAEFKLSVMCNLYSIFSCISILKSYKPKLYSSQNDRAEICTVCHVLD